MASEPVPEATEAERERFAELEAAIELGPGAFAEVGHALLEIQQRRLYRSAGHRTFAGYVSKRWDLSSAHAYRQIDASKVVDLLAPGGGLPLPANEAQARELAPLAHDPDAIRAVWTETVQQTGGRVTARAIRERVAARRDDPRAHSAEAGERRVITCPHCGHTWSAEEEA
jgi:hypothetical protein